MTDKLPEVRLGENATGGVANGFTLPGVTFHWCRSLLQKDLIEELIPTFGALFPHLP